MKIVVITATRDERSGWGRYAARLIGALEAQGVSVLSISEDSGQENAPRLLPLRKHPFINLIRNAYTAYRAARGSDVIHALDGWPYGVYGYLASLATGKPLCVSGVGTYSVVPLTHRLKGFLLRRAYLHARMIPCISAYTRDKILSYVPGARVTVVHLGVTPLPQPSQENLARYRRDHDIPADAYPVILTVGRIQDRKGQKTTVEAVGRLRAAYPRILYLMVGSPDASYRDGVLAVADSIGIADRIRIVTDAATDNDLACCYALCDIVALNSVNDHGHFEGFGLVIAEGYGFDKPAIGSRDCGIEDAIDEGRSGMLSRQSDPADIESGIGSILASYPDFSKNAKMKASQFAWEKTAMQYADIYTSIMSTRS